MRTINLEDALFALRAACRIAADRLDAITPGSSGADLEAARWIANGVEALTREAERHGASKGLAVAGKRLADAAEQLDTLARIRKAWRACDVIERRLHVALAAYGLPAPPTGMPVSEPSRGT